MEATLITPNCLAACFGSCRTIVQQLMKRRINVELMDPNCLTAVDIDLREAVSLVYEEGTS